MRAATVLAMGFALLLVPAEARAQNIGPKQVYGHEEWKDAGEQRRRELYDIATGLPFAERSFHFTSQNHLHVAGALWGEHDVQLDMSGSGRIVTEVGLSDGKYATEYYFDEGRLLLVYETRYFVAEAAPEPISTNFKNIPAWERLSIFVDGRIHYAHSGGQGAPTPGMDGSTLRASGANLMREFGAFN